MVQVTGERRHAQTGRRLRLAILRPAFGGGDVHRGQDCLVRLWQRRCRAVSGFHRKLGRFAATCQSSQNGAGQKNTEVGHGEILGQWSGVR